MRNSSYCINKFIRFIIAGAYSPTVEEYEKGGGTYPDFILQRIKKLEDGADTE